MKKILFSLATLVCSMSMNAQVMKVMKNGKEVAEYNGADYEFVFEEAPAFGTGTAKRTGDIEVTWVQLWEDGPKFAKYNVGAASNEAEDYGGYYCWGKSTDKDSNGAYKSGSDELTGTDDTATNLWGSAWRMPTQTELQALLANCDVEWTTINGVNGRKFTGKGDYKDNSVFLPAAGYGSYGSVKDQGDYGDYWSSTPYNSSYTYYLDFDSDGQNVCSGNRANGYSVRAVLAE